MRSPRNSIASTVRNSGAVKVMAVTSANGIIVSAANKQNMLIVPDNDRSACERQFAVLSSSSRPVCHAISATIPIDNNPRTKMV
jgi:hypothetical protein